MFTNLTATYANGNNPDIKGRDKEIKRLFLTLLRHEKPNALLLGDAGVGKTSVVNQLAYLLANQLCPKELIGFEVISVNTNSLISGDGYRGVIEKKFKDMIDTALAKGKCILFFDEFHTIYNLGKMAGGQTPGLSDTLKPYLTRGDFRVVGATTHDEIKTVTDAALLRRFSKLFIGEPDEHVILEIIKSCFKRFIGTANIKVKPAVVEQIYNLSLSLAGLNPDKCKDIIDIVVADAKLNDISEINPGFVSTTFDLFFMDITIEKIEEQKKAKEVDVFSPPENTF